MKSSVKRYPPNRPFLTIIKDGTLLVRQATDIGYAECPIGCVFDSSYPTSDVRRGRVQGGKIHPTITASACGVVLYENIVEYEF